MKLTKLVMSLISLQLEVYTICIGHNVSSAGDSTFMVHYRILLMDLKYRGTPSVRSSILFYKSEFIIVDSEASDALVVSVSIFYLTINVVNKGHV